MAEAINAAALLEKIDSIAEKSIKKCKAVLKELDISDSEKNDDGVGSN